MEQIRKNVLAQLDMTREHEEEELLAAIADSHGNDNVVIYLKSTRGMKVLPSSQRVSADERLQEKLGILFGAENVKIR